MTPDDLIAGLPGETLVREGIADLAAGRKTVASYLAQIALPRLRRAGLVNETRLPLDEEPELALYGALGAEPGDAYARYNALVRELVSFEMALDHRLRKNSTA
ncbi:MAG TPA: hypothetical protein VE967_05635 [Gemmatimonadaceae bacterium]|nr:hypothetical protein [Gemmatimonadaceae bacterium]